MAAVVLTGYFDETGHTNDPTLHFVSMAGFVARSEAWIEAVRRAKASKTLPFASLCDQSERRRTRQEFASPRKTCALLTEPPLARKASPPAKQRDTKAT